MYSEIKTGAPKYLIPGAANDALSDIRSIIFYSEAGNDS